MILLWYDPTDRPSTWSPPELEGFSKLTYVGRSETLVACHIQEIPENGADTAHVNYVHRPFFIPQIWFLNHGWHMTWKAGAQEHIGEVSLDEWFTITGRYVPGSKMHVQVSQLGPALVHLQLFTPLGRVWIIEAVSPAAPRLQRFYHTMYCEWTVPLLIAKIVFAGFHQQVTGDIRIWNKKKIFT